MRAQPVLEQVDDAATRKRRIDCKIGSRAGLHEQRTGGIHLYHLAVALELPRRHGAAREAASQAGMLEQVAWVPGAAAPLEVVARGGCGEPLDARANRYRDHVFLQPFVVADSCIAPRRQDIDEAIVGDYLQSDLGKRCEEA